MGEVLSHQCLQQHHGIQSQQHCHCQLLVLMSIEVGLLPKNTKSPSHEGTSCLVTNCLGDVLSSYSNMGTRCMGLLLGP